MADFYVARKYPADDQRRHGFATRNFWVAWFSNDNVFLSSDHLPYLRRQLETIHLSEHRARMPYLFWMRMPYYIFVGRKEQGLGISPQPFVAVVAGSDLGVSKCDGYVQLVYFA